LRFQRPANAAQGEVSVEPVFDGHARMAQGIAQVCLQRDQLWQIGTSDTGPDHARAPDIGEGSHALCGQSKALMTQDDRREGHLEPLDLGTGKVAEEVQGQMHPLDGIDPKCLVKRLKGVEELAQCRADGLWNLDREKDAPALGLIRWHCRP
jgi:hypothetical protein